MNKKIQNSRHCMTICINIIMIVVLEYIFLCRSSINEKSIHDSMEGFENLKGALRSRKSKHRQFNVVKEKLKYCTKSE